MKRRFAAALILLMLVFGSVFCSYAASGTETKCADALYELGLFEGTGTNPDGTPIYSLDKAPTRGQALVMLIRLMGLETEALSGKYTMPFTDVPEWLSPYVAYAYNKGLTSGVSATKFGSNRPATEAHYLTFVLRALGYNDEAGDFYWEKAKELTNKLGITDGPTDAYFLRGDITEISYSALNAKLKGQNTSLLDYLYEKGAIKSNKLPVNMAFPIRATVTNETAALAKAKTVPFSFSYLGDNAEGECYKVVVDPAYTAESHYRYTVRYGNSDSLIDTIVSDICTLDQVKKGVTVTVKFEDIERHKSFDSKDSGVLWVNRDFGVAEYIGKTGFLTGVNTTDNPKKSKVAFKSNVNGEIYDKMLAAFGFGDNIELIPYPQTDAEYINNFLYLYVRGEWKYDTVGTRPSGADWTWYDFTQYNWTLGTYLGELPNPMCVYAKDGKFYVHAGGSKPLLTEEEICQRLIYIYEEGLRIKEAIRKDKYITDKSSELDIAKAYAKYLPKYLFAETGGKAKPNPGPKGNNQLNNGAYAVMHDKFGTCAPHAHTYCLMLNMEGISAYPISMVARGRYSHVASFFVADGREYIGDWFNGTDVVAFDDMASALLETSDDECVFARLLVKYNGNILKLYDQFKLHSSVENLPYTVELVGSGYSSEKYETYRIKLDPSLYNIGARLRPMLVDPVSRTFIQLRDATIEQLHEGYEFQLYGGSLKSLGISGGILKLRVVHDDK